MKNKGFTLVELVIVILVTSILAVISVPIYKDYVRQSRYAEGYTFIAQIRDAQLLYRGEWGNFLRSSHTNSGNNAIFTSYDAVLGINGRLNKYYTWFCINNMNDADSKYAFCIWVALPKELKKSSLARYIALTYSLTGESEYREFDY